MEPTVTSTAGSPEDVPEGSITPSTPGAGGQPPPVPTPGAGHFRDVPPPGPQAWAGLAFPGLGHLLSGRILDGVGLMVLTGLTLFSVRAADYVALPLIWAKMRLIASAGLNLAALLWVGRGKRLFGGLSLLIWLGVLFAGRFLGFVYAA